MPYEVLMIIFCCFVNGNQAVKPQFKPQLPFCNFGFIGNKHSNPIREIEIYLRTKELKSSRTYTMFT